MQNVEYVSSSTLIFVFPLFYFLDTQELNGADLKNGQQHRQDRLQNGRGRIGDIGRGRHRHSRSTGPALSLLHRGQCFGHRDILPASSSPHLIQQVCRLNGNEKKNKRESFLFSRIKIINRMAD